MSNNIDDILNVAAQDAVERVVPDSGTVRPIVITMFPPRYSDDPKSILSLAFRGLSLLPFVDYKITSENSIEISRMERLSDVSKFLKILAKPYIIMVSEIIHFKDISASVEDDSTSVYVRSSSLRESLIFDEKSNATVKNSNYFCWRNDIPKIAALYRLLLDGPVGNDEICSELMSHHFGCFLGMAELEMNENQVARKWMFPCHIVKDELNFFENEELVSAVENAKSTGKALHLYGLLSEGGVHSHITHLYALLELAKQRGLEKVYVHAFMDGRDVPPTSGASYVKALSDKISEIGVGKISTITGRYYAMDRDTNWDRVKLAYDSLTKGVGKCFENPVEAVEASYKEGVTDEFILPINIVENGKPIGLIEKGDSIIFFNYRPDRAREITRAFSEPEFSGFDRGEFLNPYYVCFTQYDASFTNVKIAFKKQEIVNTLGQYLADKGYTQLRIAETEKYAHVTFFFNGGKEAPEKNEIRDLIPSPKVATYDLKPEMSALKVTEKFLEELDSDKFDVMILNYANCDMVGHTGVLNAAVRAVNTVESCVQILVQAVLAKGGACLITADHGNADCMIAEDGSPFTAHTTNPVPFILVDDDLKDVKLADGGILADIAPTLLTVMGEQIPSEMTGKCLIKK